MYPLTPLTNPGTYAQGTKATLIISTIRAKGEPANFTNPTIMIEDEAETTTVVAETAMTRAPEGYYFYDWDVPAALTPGTYVATFSSDLLDVAYQKKQQLTVVENSSIPTQTVLNQNAESDLIVGLYYMIKETQEIPVEYEQAKITSNGLKAVLTFNNLNAFYDKMTVYRNGEISNSGYTVDYDNGEIIFSSALTEFDTINVDYNFSWFKADELMTFLRLAVNEINLIPPGGGNRTIGNAPEIWYPAIIYGAAKNVYRRLIHDLCYQQPRLVYGGLDPNNTANGGVDKAVDNFRYLKENYEKDFEAAAKNAKRNLWPAPGAVVASEFTMPGGRSRWFRYLYKG